MWDLQAFLSPDASDLGSGSLAPTSAAHHASDGAITVPAIGASHPDDFGSKWPKLTAVQVGLSLRSLPLDSRPDSLPANIDPNWAGRFSPDELALRKAVLTTL